MPTIEIYLSDLSTPKRQEVAELLGNEILFDSSPLFTIETEEIETPEPTEVHNASDLRKYFAELPPPPPCASHFARALNYLRSGKCTYPATYAEDIIKQLQLKANKGAITFANYQIFLSRLWKQTEPLFNITCTSPTNYILTIQQLAAYETTKEKVA